MSIKVLCSVVWSQVKRKSRYDYTVWHFKDTKKNQDNVKILLIFFSSSVKYMDRRQNRGLSSPANAVIIHLKRLSAHSIRVPGRPLPHNPAISTLLYRTMAGANRSSLFLPMCLKEIRHEESFLSYKVKGHLHRCGQDNILTRIQDCRHQKAVCQSGIRKLIISFSTLTLHVPTGVPFNRRPSTLTGVWLSACNVSSAVR